MIKLQQLNKYFFKRKANEIHVINDISLELPEKGLVVLLGPSGSGKTTLLNVIGGLDKPQNGVIDFDGEELKKYQSRKWDEIRNRKIGYIFQNYNLLTDITVYDNIKMTLNMAGITDKDEIDKRINYILESIGMINYRKRIAAALSGGQQQRVAIARALAKNPKVIIADEPTGNLDSKNSIDIMNIIKSISKEKLVILVTHERELADFYADRVIELEDGKVVRDQDNTAIGDLEYRHEADIYLKDLRNITNASFDGSSVKVYTDDETDTTFDIRIVIKNKTVYLDVQNDEYPKQKLLDASSEVKLLDRHYEKISNTNFEGTEFNLDQVVDDSKIDKKKSVISFRENLQYAFKKFTNVRFTGIILYFGFFAIAFLTSIAVGLISNLLEFTPDRYLRGEHKDSILVYYDEDLTYEEYLDFEKESHIDMLIPFESSVTLNFKVPKIFQAQNLNLTKQVQMADVSLMDGNRVVGRLPKAYNEVVIDEYVAKAIINSSEFQDLGIDNIEDLLEVPFVIPLESPYSSVDYEINIVGVYQTESPVLYGELETLYMIYNKIGIYEIFEDDITLVRGELFTETTDILTLDNPDYTGDLENIMMMFSLEENITIRTSGTYNKTSDDIPDALIPVEALKELLFDSVYNVDGEYVLFHSNDLKESSDFFKQEELEHVIPAIDYKESFGQERIANGLSILIFALVLLGASFVSYFFVLRSSLLSRIYEISVYRALGASKFDLIKIFFTEVVLVTTLTSLPGYALSAYIFYSIQEAGGGIIEFMNYSLISMTLGMLYLYLVNIISGLLPVSNLLRRTPAEILSRYDF